MVVFERSGSIETEIVVVLLVLNFLFFRCGEQNLFGIELPFQAIRANVRFQRPFFFSITVEQGNSHVSPSISD